jgi:hypothetical protein
MNIAKKRLSILATIFLTSVVVVPAFVQAASHNSSSKMKSGMKMGMVMVADAPTVPAVNGFIDGQKMLFIHTEVSDAGVAKILTDMMGGSPVPVVPSLAKATAEMLAPVYVFTNGHSGMGPMGPLGGQPDIFDKAPGEEGYSPLRNIILVTWSEGASISTLKSLDELKSAIDSGAVSTKEAGIVVNMPFLTWPGGKR